MQNRQTAEAPVLPEQKNYVPLLGYLLLIASAALFGLYEWLGNRGSQDFTVFVMHYLLAIGYMVMLINARTYGFRKSWRKKNLGSTIVLLNLFLISAYALNRALPVFEDSATWLCVFLILTSLNLLSFQYAAHLPRWLNYIQYTILGSAFILYLYMTLFVADMYIVGTIGIIAFGIGAHIFVPLTLLVACIYIVIHTTRLKTISFLCVVSGSVITLIVVVVFTTLWSNRVQTIERAANQSVLYNNNSLPVWIQVSQNLPVDALSQKVLKSDLVYTVSSNKFGDWFFMPNNLSWHEARKHDPLVFIASMFAEPPLSRNDKIKILQTLADRHRAEERLWSGENLSTTYVVSDIDLYPELRLSYTEKYLTIKNHAKERGRRSNTEEAIYTFQLPEGSVVTSLSLWINGKEEKGILTSKQKAKTAYNTIVGVEVRDPSVIHWQEGNTVSVRVFPCTVEEDRKFKIGITSPLIEEEGRIVYKSPGFKGPHAGNASETIRVRVIGSSTIEMPGTFKKDKKGDYIAEQSFDPDFAFSFPSVPLQKGNHFRFDGYEYSLDSYKPEFQAFQKSSIYLDINTTWSQNELNELKDLINSKKVFVYTEEEFVSLNADNWDDLTKALQERSFSLFPFHLLQDAEHALVITKGRPLSIQLSDFRESDFAKGLANFFAAGKKPYVYNLGTDVSTYIASMRELRGFEFAQGNVETLLGWLKEGKYPKTSEHDELVVLHDSKLTLTKQKIKEGTPITKANAPDHLARLFAYNNILRKVGTNYFNDDFINDALVDEATTAYVVSPVSSLIVLESQEDYKRFGIEDKENSLHNASKDSSGAVPEPHEWALIVLFLMFVLFMRYRATKLKIA